MSLENFNPLVEVFEQPDPDTDLHKEFKDLARADLHNTNLYDEEGEAHGGEKINPETGKPNTDLDGEPVVDDLVSERGVKPGNRDMMGDVKDPSKMSLEELLATQDDEL